jgi:hypothetical protein
LISCFSYPVTTTTTAATTTTTTPSIIYEPIGKPLLIDFSILND